MADLLCVDKSVFLSQSRFLSLIRGRPSVPVGIFGTSHCTSSIYRSRCDGGTEKLLDALTSQKTAYCKAFRSRLNRIGSDQLTSVDAETATKFWIRFRLLVSLYENTQTQGGLSEEIENVHMFTARHLRGLPCETPLEYRVGDIIRPDRFKSITIEIENFHNYLDMCVCLHSESAVAKTLLTLILKRLKELCARQSAGSAALDQDSWVDTLKSYQLLYLSLVNSVDSAEPKVSFFPVDGSG
jgi:hypothetical protein